MLVYIGTTNTTYGNPRRGWIVNYGTQDAFFVDEGYEGRQALKRHGIDPAAGDVPKLDVTASVYRFWSHRTAEDLEKKRAILAKLGG